MYCRLDSLRYNFLRKDLLMNRSLAVLFLTIAALSAVSCNTGTVKAPASTASPASSPEQFITEAEKKLAELSINLNKAQWVAANFITDDTEALSANTNKESIAVVTELAEAAR